MCSGSRRLSMLFWATTVIVAVGNSLTPDSDGASTQDANLKEAVIDSCCPWGDGLAPCKYNKMCWRSLHVDFGIQSGVNPDATASWLCTWYETTVTGPPSICPWTHTNPAGVIPLFGSIATATSPHQESEITTTLTTVVLSSPTCID